MARRADHTPDQLRTLVLTKGLEIIDKKGLPALTARSLAAAIGYTPGTLYHVFGSLDSYMLHLAMHAVELWHVQLTAKLNRSRKDALETLAHAYIDFSTQYKHRWQLIFAHSTPAKAELPDGYVASMSRLLGLIDGALVTREPDARKRHTLAKTLWASMHGICALAQSRMLAHSAADNAHELARQLLDLATAKPRKKDA